jgi:hypothetical protein
MRRLWDLFPFIIIIVILIVIIASPDWLNSLVIQRSDYERPTPLPTQVPGEKTPPGEEVAPLDTSAPLDSAQLRRLDSIMTARAIDRAMRDLGK